MQYFVPGQPGRTDLVGKATTSNLIDQARLLLSLLLNGSPSNLSYHSSDFEAYFIKLRDNCAVSHSVSPRFPHQSVLILDELLLLLHQPTPNLKSIIRLRLVLDDIIDRRVRFEVKE